MDILTQYFNESGKIVSKTPSLSSREFYRDVLCRYPFKGMDTLSNRRKQVGWYQTYNGIYIDCSAGQDSYPTLYPEFRSEPEIYNDGYTYPYSYCGEYTVVDGYNGGKAIKPVPYSYDDGETTGNLIKTCLFTNKCGNIVSDKMRLRIVAKSPILSEHVNGYPQCFIDLESDNFHINFGIKSTGDVGYFFCSISGPDGSDYFEVYGSNAPFVLDGAWHVYDVVVEKNEPTIINIDGSILWTGAEINYSGSCLNPYLFCLLDTATEDYTVSLSSISWEKI